jgi:hypothetical protein
MTARMCSPSLAPDDLDGLPSLDCWSFLGKSHNGGRAWTAHGWLCGHPTLPDDFHTTDLLMGFDFEGRHWVETRNGGFYRLLRPLFGPGTFIGFDDGAR